MEHCPYSGVTYSPEELLGMLLHRAKEFAEATAGHAVNEMVLIVPGYFNQAERQAMLQAADLAGFKVLQLMNDYTAGTTVFFPKNLYVSIAVNWCETNHSGLKQISQLSTVSNSWNGGIWVIGFILL